MKLIKPSFEIWEQDSYNESKSELLSAIYKQIERVGRVCYKSEDKITDDSAQPFVQRLIASKHYAMLEHGTVYLAIEAKPISALYMTNGECIPVFYAEKYEKNKYSHLNYYFGMAYITTNLRVIVENGWEDDLQYICSPTEYHAQRHTVHFVCNRQVSHGFVRHRVFSFAQESTRYCNYTKGRFGGGLTFINPNWCDFGGNYTTDERMAKNKDCCHLLQGLKAVEETYLKLISDGWLPQQAATILPNALKTELVMTGFDSDWEHFFELRALGTTGAPHPQAKELAEPLMQEFIKKVSCKLTFKNQK